MFIKRLTLIAPALQAFLLAMLVGLTLGAPIVVGIIFFAGIVSLCFATVQFAWIDSFEMQLIKYSLSAGFFLSLAFLWLAFIIGGDQEAMLLLGIFAIVFAVSQGFWFWLERRMIRLEAFTPYKKARRFYAIPTVQVVVLGWLFSVGLVINFIYLPSGAVYGLLLLLLVLSVTVVVFQVKGLESFHAIIVKYGILFIVFLLFGLFDQFIGTLYLIFSGSLLAMFRFEMKHLKGGLPWRNRANVLQQKSEDVNTKK